VEEPQFISHIVAKGETLASIAERYLGKEGSAGVIAAANPLLSPQDLAPGRVIRIPKDPNNIQGKPLSIPLPEPGTPEFWTVQAGDTLGTISQRVYGTVKHTQLIFDANKDQLRSPDKLKAGMRLALPPRPIESKKQGR
jgi:nucleoid-associated protein YgaU